MKYVLLLVVLSTILSACTISEYERMRDRELASGVRNDSIFMGISFGMKQKDFYTHCWNLNKQGLIMQGPGNLSVQYELSPPDMRDECYMWFYPDFDSTGVIKMPVEFSYKSWAPWSMKLSADSLLLDAKNLFEKWYGPGFIEVKDQQGEKKAWVKMDGNRRIRLFKKNISTVHGDITDMTKFARNDE